MITESMIDGERVVLIDGDVEFIRDYEGDMAILVDIDGIEVWIPRSEILEQDNDSLTIPLWLAEAKGIV